MMPKCEYQYVECACGATFTTWAAYYKHYKGNTLPLKPKAHNAFQFVSQVGGIIIKTQTNLVSDLS